MLQLTPFDFRCSLFLGGISEIFVLLHFLNLLRKIYFGKTQEITTQALKDCQELMLSSVSLVVLCHLFAYFHYYLLYLPFNLVFHLHLRLLWPLNTLVYPLIIWALPTYAGMSLWSMIDPFINPARHPKIQ
jgi:hypothetical protein